MSYCVNCGVELDPTCTSCPLCHTKVYNPNHTDLTETVPPFPTLHGETEPVRHYEFTILMTIIFLTTSVVCGLLNHFTFPIGKWSYYVSGACVMFWIFLIPVFFPGKTNPFLNLTLDRLSIAAYFFMISILHPGNGWYLHIALPIIVLSTVCTQIVYLFSVTRKSSMIAKTVVVLGNIAVFCTILELLIDYHFYQELTPSWSAVVLTCCMSVDIILLTICSLKGIRNELRRRMHF